MSLRETLDERGIDYDIQQHELAYDAQHVAAAEHVSGWDVAKPVILDVGGDLVMVVVPAPMEVDLEKAGAAFGGSVSLAHEDDFADLFEDADKGAQPPDGTPYGVPTYVDQSMRARERIICRDGSHTETVGLSMDDYLAVVQPAVVDVATPQD